MKVLLFLFLFSSHFCFALPDLVKQKPSLKQESNAIKSLSSIERKDSKTETKSHSTASAKAFSPTLSPKKAHSRAGQFFLVLLCIVGFIACPIWVGIWTGWERSYIIKSLLLWLLIFVPSILYSILVICDVV